MYWLFAVWAVTWAVIFITINLSREDRYVLSTFAMTAELYFVLYLNRFEPKYMSLDKESLEITYVTLKSYINYKHSYPRKKVTLKVRLKY
jgi:hypothetical protein